MARPALLAGAMAIPLGRIHDLAGVEKTLTATYTPMGELPVEVLCYSLDDDYLYAPRQFGLDYCKRHGIEIEDQTSLGHPAKFARTPTPRDYQVDIIDELVDTTAQFYDFLFRAHTGWGKTIGCLIMAARIGRTTLIIVDQDNLKDQWQKELKQHFDMTPENGGVGFIQGKVCDYKHPVVIAMVHTLSQKQFPQEVYDYFGTVLVDEVHTVGAPTFSTVLRDFPATYRVGASATPKRKDGLQKMLDFNLGKVRVAADKEHDESSVYFLNHPTVYSFYANISPKIGRILTEVSEDGARNLLAAETIMLLWETGRDVIALGDRIEQLQHLIDMLYYMGFGDETGLYCGMEPHWRYAKNPTPARRPEGWVKHEETGQLEYTPISLQLIAKKIPKSRLQEVKANARMFFATYGMCAKGFDEPRLCAGIDLTPRGAAEQIHGRILRTKRGKKQPIWVTIVDENNYRFVYAFGNRVADYVKSNAIIYRWGADGELVECHAGDLRKKAKLRVAALKEMEIQPNRNGGHTLMSPASKKTQKRQHVKDTVAAIRSRRRVSKEDS